MSILVWVPRMKLEYFSCFNCPDFHIFIIPRRLYIRKWNLILKKKLSQITTYTESGPTGILLWIKPSRNEILLMLSQRRVNAENS